MSLSIAAYSQAGDLIEDADVDDNANIQISKLTTRTLSFSFPAVMSQKSGSGVISSFLGVYGGVVLPDANTGNLYMAFPLPDEWVSGGIITVRVWWKTAATAGNVKFSGLLKSTTKDGTTASEETVTVTDAANGTTNLINDATMAFAAADFTAGDIVGFNLKRDPADAADTLSSDTLIFAIDFEFTGRG